MKSLLKSSIIGQSILLSYREHGILTESLRGHLVEILAREMLKYNHTCVLFSLTTNVSVFIFLIIFFSFVYRPSDDEYMEVANKICSLFPTEKVVRGIHYDLFLFI